MVSKFPTLSSDLSVKPFYYEQSSSAPVVFNKAFVQTCQHMFRDLYTMMPFLQYLSHYKNTIFKSDLKIELIKSDNVNKQAE